MRDGNSFVFRIAVDDEANVEFWPSMLSQVKNRVWICP